MASSLPDASRSSDDASPAISVRSFSANYDPNVPHRDDESSPLFSRLASHVRSRDRQRLLHRLTVLASFFCSILSALSAGSILAYSLYGPLFISKLHYTQYQVNAVSTVAEVGMYLPVPVFGYIADRYGPRPLSAFSGILFGAAYLLAAGVWRSGLLASEEEAHRTQNGLTPVMPGGRSAPHHHHQPHGWPFPIMVLAFAFVGLGTSCMYMSAVTTCAKNFGRGRHKGLALGAPIAAFGLSGMWQSQVGTRYLSEPETGELDVFRYFVFLAVLLFSVGMIGVLGLKVVDEEGMIEEAEERMERSRLLPHPSDRESYGYGTVEASSSQKPPSISSRRKESSIVTMKSTLLNAETRLFLTDPTMWLLAFGFFLVSGPGETYQNNVGTLIHTAYPPRLQHPHQTVSVPNYNKPSTHVALIAIASTLTRLLSGTLSDILAPSPQKRQESRFYLSRLNFLIAFCVLYSFALILLATPLPDKHHELFVAASSLVGLGYGSLFSLTPILISVVWGVENFGTNWGLVATVPAPGAAIWGLIYSAVYEDHARRKGECYGSECYRTTFICMAVASWVAIASWLIAWRKWKGRGVLV